MKNQILTWIAASFFFTSCEMVVKIDVPNIPSKLVVTCFISPQDTVWRVYVGQTTPVFGKVKPSDDISNATVQISNGTQSVTIPNNFQDYYELNTKQAPFPIVAGKTYYISVAVPDGRQVKAQCTIPASIISINSVEVTGENDFGVYLPFKGTIKWQDNPNETNFYRCFAYTKIYDNLAGGAIESYEQNYNSDKAFQKDTDKQGENFAWQVDMRGSRGYADNKSRLLFILLNTDEGYYKYMTTREATANSEGNPFAEPSPVYSNLEGGLGVFAGYQQYRIEVVK